MTVSAVNPCRTALRSERLLPVSVFGPELISALRRLASTCLSDAMGSRVLDRFYVALCSVAADLSRSLVVVIRRVEIGPARDTSNSSARRCPPQAAAKCRGSCSSRRHKRGMEIVRTYADERKSGLSLNRRESLKRLIQDVQAGHADFTAIIVFHVTRWGRFQDSDESVYYEYK
jgi:hypothetical protein